MKPFFFVASCILLFACSKNHNDSSGSFVLPNYVYNNSPAIDSLSSGWTKVTIPGKPWVSDIFFINNLVGYITDTVVRKSIDGGNTWTAITNYNGGRNIACTQDGKVFTLSPTTLYRSTDNGASFDSLQFATPVFDIYFTDNNNGFISGYSPLYQTSDGGSTWLPVQPTTGLTNNGNYNSLFFINSSTGWVARGESVYHTEGAINNWSPAFLDGQPTNDFCTVYALDQNIIFSVTENGGLYKSTDGGVNFQLLINLSLQGDHFADVHFIDINTGYISYANKIYKTSDGGTTWNVVVSLNNVDITEIHFTDANHGWACGYDGTVLIYKQ